MSSTMQLKIIPAYLSVCHFFAFMLYCYIGMIVSLIRWGYLLVTRISRAIFQTSLYPYLFCSGTSD
jgi:hypothetical protein